MKKIKDGIDLTVYSEFLKEIKRRVLKSQYEAFKAVNKELIALYWDIGKIIVLRQKRQKWGDAVVEKLAMDLQNEFPGIQGFSRDNIWRMRKFYQYYSAHTKLAPLVQEISWTKNIVILERCQGVEEQEFYIIMTKKFGWTKDVLIHQIDNKSFEKYHLNQTNFDKTLPEKIKNQAKLAVKDEYMFDFLELGEEHLENELERALMRNMRRFLLEMGGYFCFVANQYRIEIDDKEFFIDLLLYHRRLKCLVAIELKVGDFKPEYAGKMQFYLSALNDKVKLEEENPSIGIIVCRSKKRTIVEYALKDVNKPIGISTYKVSAALPKQILKYLPSAEELARSLEIF